MIVIVSYSNKNLNVNMVETSARNNFELLLKEFCKNHNTNFGDYKVEFHGCYHQALKDGKLNGPFVTYHVGTNFKILEILYYNDDMITGCHKTYSIRGELVDHHQHTNENVKCPSVSIS